jgi:hypothetical protein
MDNNNVNALTSRTHPFSTLNNGTAPFKKIRLIIIAIMAVMVLSYWFYQKQEVTNQASQLITHPKIDDIYYLDFRLFSENLRPKEKFRFAKVTDITGNIVTLLYGNFFYMNEQSMRNSIHYGHFRYKKYFSTYRNNFTQQELTNLQKTGAIFKIERPISSKLHSNFIKPQYTEITSTQFLPGKQENISGESYLKATNIQNHYAIAFEYFKESAQLNYAQGQINLAQMYLSTRLEQQDFNKALFWLKQAALQSNKAAINKYTIVCKKVSQCNIDDFYQSLLAAGVNIRFNKKKQI